MKALVQAAHEKGLLVFVHNESEEASDEVMQAGADVNIHAPGLDDFKRDPLGDQFAERFAKSVKAVVPTMTIMLQGVKTRMQ